MTKCEKTIDDFCWNSVLDIGFCLCDSCFKNDEDLNEIKEYYSFYRLMKGWNILGKATHLSVID